MSETRFEAELNRRISLVVRGFVILGLLMLVSVQNWTTTSSRSGDARVLWDLRGDSYAQPARWLVAWSFVAMFYFGLKAISRGTEAAARRACRAAMMSTALQILLLFVVDFRPVMGIWLAVGPTAAYLWLFRSVSWDQSVLPAATWGARLPAWKAEAYGLRAEDQPSTPIKIRRHPPAQNPSEEQTAG